MRSTRTPTPEPVKRSIGPGRRTKSACAAHADGYVRLFRNQARLDATRPPACRTVSASGTGLGPLERLIGTKARPADARCRAAWRRRGRILECSMGKRMSGPGCSFATLAKRGLGRPRHSRPRLRSGFRSIRRHPRNVRFRRFGDGSAWDAAACNLVAEPDHERDTRAW